MWTATWCVQTRFLNLFHAVLAVHALRIDPQSEEAWPLGSIRHYKEPGCRLAKTLLKYGLICDYQYGFGPAQWMMAVTCRAMAIVLDTVLRAGLEVEI